MVHYAKSPKPTNIGLFAWETGDQQTKTKACQQKSKTIVFISDHRPTKQLPQNSFQLRVTEIHGTLFFPFI
jgi:hypothetical protein